MKMFFCTVIVVSISFAQFGNRSTELPQDTLAKIGSHIVTASDFLERFELMPWPNKEQASRIEFSKLQFLYSMVAEKLLAIEASAQNIGNDSTSLNFQRNLERLLVRDELYKQEVLPNVSISDAERSEGMHRFPLTIETQILGIISRQEGEMLRKKILSSRNKNAAFKRFYDSLYVPLDTLEMTFGYADKKIEDAIFSMEKDSISLPVEMERYGLVMFRLLKRYSHPENSRLSIPDRLHKVENIISRRKEDSLAVRTFAAITSPQRAEADTKIFLRLADSVLSILKSDSMNYQSNGIYKFPATAVNLLAKEFAPDLSQQFVTIASGAMTIGDVLQGLGNNNIVFPSLNHDHIRIVLNKNIKTVIQNELLSREGMKNNLQQSKTVRHDVATWMDSKKSWLLTRAVIDSVRVTGEEIEAEYQKHPQMYGATVMVRVREILVDSIKLAKEIRARLNNGEAFSTLAKQYSKRKEWALQGGESPWFNVTSYGELGMYASAAKIGEMNGPLRISNGLTIYSVIEKKIIDDSLRENFGKTTSAIEHKLLAEKQKQSLDKYIGTLAKKYNVAIRESALRNVKTTTTSMVTWRNIGFGGKIVAVPQMIPQTEWVYEWLKQQQLNQ